MTTADDRELARILADPVARAVLMPERRAS